MTDYAELELVLNRRDSGSYALDMRFSQPDSDADIRLLRNGAAIVQFDIAALQARALDVAAYGRSLSASLVADPAAHTAFAQALRSAGSLDAPLRVRLFIGPNASELHTLRWETLYNPLDASPLLTTQSRRPVS